MNIYKVAAMLAAVFTLSNAQENLRSQFFNDVEKIMNQAKEKNAGFYSEVNYSKGMKYYNDAKDYFARGKKIEDVREKIKNAEAYFTKSLEICRVADTAFTSTKLAKTDAEKAGAQKYSKELWNKAEEEFRDAAAELEEGSAGNAREKGKEAESNYRAAELEAIKTNYLSAARDLIKNADVMDVKDNAPHTLQKAKDLVAQVENLLKQNRYDTDEARQLAEEAKYEAAHAVYLHQTIEKMKREDKNYEDAFLFAETYFKRIASELGFLPRFDNGFENPVIEATKLIKENDSKLTKANETIQQTEETVKHKDAEIDNMKQQIDLMMARLGTLSNAEKKLQAEGKELQKKLEVQHGQEETIRKVAKMFPEQEGSVLREGDNIIIRLYGLTFPVGKISIEPEYYPLLTKVQNAIREFPKCSITIEGHTDSQGNDDINQTLSERRARVVAEYLMANMGVEIPINSQGFGESRPVASNDTPEGRAKNRRIDIVITPEWAQGGK